MKQILNKMKLRHKLTNSENSILILRGIIILGLVVLIIFVNIFAKFISLLLILWTLYPQIKQFSKWIFDRNTTKLQITSYKIRREERYYKFDLNDGLANLKLEAPKIPNAYDQTKRERPDLNKHDLGINDLSGKIFWEEVTTRDFIEFKNDRLSINVKKKINELPGKFIIDITLKNNLNVSQDLIFDTIKLYPAAISANNGRRYQLKIPANEYELRKYVFQLGIGIRKIQNAIIKFTGHVDKKPFEIEIEINSV